MEKKWTSRGIGLPGDKPTCLFATTHNDKVGGGDLYAHQVAMALDKMTNMRYFGGHPSAEMKDYHWISPQFKCTSIIAEYDIFVWCSHFRIHRPVGKYRNILIVMFPNKEFDPTGYDTIIATSGFVAEWIKKYWKRESIVIYPWCDPTIYKPSAERTPKKKILSVGRFFLEQNGHTKHQDILLEAFRELLLLDPDWSLSLAGSCLSDNDKTFAKHCEDIAEHEKIANRVRFHYNIKKEELLGLYQTHHFYWHANGYKSNDPYETEHFGIVFVEAMMCGATVYPYEHGGYAEFTKERAWSDIKDLVRCTVRWWEIKEKHFKAVREANRNYATEFFTEEKMEEGLKGVLFK
jgi:glycosyltransferase involved in cell wall biosynthesis